MSRGHRTFSQPRLLRFVGACLTLAGIAALFSGAAALVSPGLAPSSPVDALQDARLDPRCRIALAGLLAGAEPRVLREDRRLAVTEWGDLDVFITSSATREELVAAGARIRSVLPGGMYTAYVAPADLPRLTQLAGLKRIAGAVSLEPELDASVPATGASALRGPPPLFPGGNGQGVLIGAIDTGVCYTHDDFREVGAQTRLLRIWDQTDPVGPFPVEFSYGSEWFPPDLDGGLSRERDTNGHGSLVLGIAGGDGSATGGAVPAYTYVGMAPRADLIAVKSDLTTTGVVDGVRYVFDQANALGRNAVVNISLGTAFGPHDGTSPFEAGIASQCGPGRLVTVAAGNDGGLPVHAEVFAAGTGTPATLSANGSAVGRGFGVDGYYEATEDLLVSVVTPGGTTLGPFPRGTLNAPYPGLVTPWGNVYLENGFSTTSGGDFEVYLEVNVTTGQNMNGSWSLRFIPQLLGPANGEVDLWRYSVSAGATANFTVGADPFSEQIVEPGNASGVVTVGAWTTKQFWTDCGGHTVNFGGATAPGTLQSSSSRGPTRDGRLKPEIAAPGTAIGAARSLDIPVSCPPGNSQYLPDGMQHIVAAGTSYAAPHVAGAAALLMQQMGALSPAAFLNYLGMNAQVDGFTGVVPNNSWGLGKLHLAGDTVPPVVSLSSPTGGELWFANSLQPILWNAIDNVAVTGIDLALSTDGGVTYPVLVASGLPNSGIFNWSIPNLPTGQARIAVTAHDGAGHTATATSPSNFTILPPAADTNPPVVALARPIGGESMTAGSDDTILWNATDDVGVTSVDLALSLDGGTTFPITLATGIPNSGSLTFTVPNWPTTTARVAVTARDGAGNSATAVSPGLFRIVPEFGGNCEYPPPGTEGFDVRGLLNVTLPGLRTGDIAITGTSTLLRQPAVDVNGRLRVDVQVLTLSATGLGCLGPVQLQLSPGPASTGSFIQSAPTSCFPADGVLDLRLVLGTFGATTHTSAPLHLTADVSALPPLGHEFTSTAPVTLLNASNQPVGTLNSLRLTPQPRVYGLFASCEMDLSVDGGPLETLILTGPMVVRWDPPRRVLYPDAGLWEATSQVLALDLRGSSPTLGPLILELNPELNSPGVDFLAGYQLYPAPSQIDLNLQLRATNNSDLILRNETPVGVGGTSTGVPPSTGQTYARPPGTTTVSHWKTKNPRGTVRRFGITLTGSFPPGSEPASVAGRLVDRMQPASYPYQALPAAGTDDYCAGLDLAFVLAGEPVSLSDMNCHWSLERGDPVRLASGVSSIATHTTHLEASGHSAALNANVSVVLEEGATNGGQIEQQMPGPIFPASSTQSLSLRIIVDRSPGPVGVYRTTLPYPIAAEVAGLPFTVAHTGAGSSPLIDQFGGAAGTLQQVTIHPEFAYDGTCGTVADCGAQVTSVPEGGDLPPQLRLHPGAPNPFSRESTISFDLSQNSTVDVGIHDVSGRLVRHFVLGPLGAGPHAVSWDGHDDGGRPLASGLYPYTVRASGRAVSGRLVLVR